MIRISALNPKSRHNVTLATPRIVSVRRVKAFIWRKVVPLAPVTLPVEARQLAHPSCLSPCRDRLAILMWTVGWILQSKKLKVTSAWVTRGKGCLGYPRPYKWGLSVWKFSCAYVLQIVLQIVWLPMQIVFCHKQSAALRYSLKSAAASDVRYKLIH